MTDRSIAGVESGIAYPSVLRGRWPLLLAGVAFAVLFAEPMYTLARDWWNDPEAGHGLLLAPVSIWLVWRAGIRSDAAPNRLLGVAILVLAILLRYLSGLAAELFTMRFSMVLALAGLTVYYFGIRQLLSWWLPFLLFSMAIPLPEMVKSAMTLPLQFRASRMGAALLEWRHIPVELNGNVIQVPGRQLFVTEACSGLRSLTALVSLAVLMGALWLRTPIGRILTLAGAVGIAIVVNAVRVFLTGFLVVFVDPKLGEGFMHITEGWLLFVVSLGLTAVVAWLIGRAEAALGRPRSGEAVV